MGAGASSSSSSNENEIRLQEENQVLRRRLNQLNAQLAGGSNAVGNGSGGERSSGLSKTESKRGIQGGVNSGGESDGRRGEVSAETREVGALVANYVKVAIR